MTHHSSPIVAPRSSVEAPEPLPGRRRRPRQQQNPSLSLAARSGRPTEDEQLLVRPDGPAAAFTHTDPWRVLRIMGEFVAGFDALADVGPAVTVFGSARIGPHDAAHRKAVEVGPRLAAAGFAGLTGCGP